MRGVVAELAELVSRQIRGSLLTAIMLIPILHLIVCIRFNHSIMHSGENVREWKKNAQPERDDGNI